MMKISYIADSQIIIISLTSDIGTERGLPSTGGLVGVLSYPSGCGPRVGRCWTLMFLCTLT